MTWRTHLVGGFTSLSLIPVTLSSTSLGLACVFAALGSLLPDLDARESKLSNVELGGMTLLKPAAHALNHRLGHRGAVHSLLALLVVAVLLALPLGFLLDPFAGLGLLMGFASHLFLDACTRSGIPLWWPDTTRAYVLPRGLRVTTGSVAEEAICLLLALLAVFHFIERSRLLFSTP